MKSFNTLLSCFVIFFSITSLQCNEADNRDISALRAQSALLALQATVKQPYKPGFQHLSQQDIVNLGVATYGTKRTVDFLEQATATREPFTLLALPLAASAIKGGAMLGLSVFAFYTVKKAFFAPYYDLKKQLKIVAEHNTALQEQLEKLEKRINAREADVNSQLASNRSHCEKAVANLENAEKILQAVAQDVTALHENNHHLRKDVGLALTCIENITEIFNKVRPGAPQVTLADADTLQAEQLLADVKLSEELAQAAREVFKTSHKKDHSLLRRFLHMPQTRV